MCKQTDRKQTTEGRWRFARREIIPVIADKWAPAAAQWRSDPVSPFPVRKHGLFGGSCDQWGWGVWGSFLKQTPEHLLWLIVSALRQQLIKPDGRSRKSVLFFSFGLGSEEPSARLLARFFSFQLHLSSAAAPPPPSPPSALGRRRAPAAGLGVHLGHQQSEFVSGRADQLAAPERKNTVKMRQLAGRRLSAPAETLTRCTPSPPG